MPATYEEFKGQKVIVLQSQEVEGRYPVKLVFGKAKARLIIEHLAEVNKFAQEPDTPQKVK